MCWIEKRLGKWDHTPRGGCSWIAGAQQTVSASAEPLEELARAEARWFASKTEAYEYRFQYACNGLIAPTPAGVQPGFLFRVKDRESTYLKSRGEVPVAVAAELVQYSTVEKLFANHGRCRRSEGMTQRMAFRSCVLLGSIVLSVQVTRGQERAPNGEIYNELRPFVGLEGIRYQITGLEGVTVFNVRGIENVADPERQSPD